MKNRRRLTALLLLISLFSCVEPYDMGSHKTEYPQEDFSANKANLLENGGLEEWNMFPYHYDIPTGWYCHNNTNVKKDGKIKNEGMLSSKQVWLRHIYKEAQTGEEKKKIMLSDFFGI